ncbi:MAG TPA: hypothetical protein P5322_11220, partial [Spirochaetota bacterium]|nr:hypothetical protein [Spirochaetota bacterium]
IHMRRSICVIYSPQETDGLHRTLYLALIKASKKLTTPIQQNWGQALNQFAVYFGNRALL